MKIGDRVSLLDDDLEGTVRKVTGDSVLIETLDGFEMSFSKNELVVVDSNISIDPTSSDWHKRIEEKQEAPKKKRSQRSGKQGNQTILEIDLHAEQLTKDHKRMPAHEILELQLETARRQLNFARSKGIRKVILIHGVGAGVLRAELEFLLNRESGLNYQDGDYRKYGLGALEVYLLQNPGH